MERRVHKCRHNTKGRLFAMEERKTKGEKMIEKIVEIETLSLRDYIDKEMTKLRSSCLEGFKDPNTRERLPEIMCDNARNIALQEIAFRLEYGFITEIGTTDLKNHLPRA